MPLKLVSTDSVFEELPRLADLKRRVSGNDPMTGLISTASIGKSLQRPKFQNCQRLFYVNAGSTLPSTTLAAVVARVSPTLRDDGGKPVGMVGFFDAVDEFEPAEIVLCAADEWLRENGCESIVGPIDGDTWHHYRFNIGPHQDPPFLLEPTNPEYYPELFIKSGFETLDRYHSLRVDSIDAVMPLLRPAFDSARSQGYRFRRIRLDRYVEELRRIYTVSTAAFCENFLYDEVSWDEFQSLYLGAKSLIRPELVWFVEDAEGTAIGFLFCLVDWYRAIASMKGRTNLLAKLKFLWNRYSADAVNFKTLAVIPEHRRSQLGGALMYHGYRESLKLGFTKANLCLIRDGNVSSRLDGGKSRILRRYELYQTPGSRLSNAAMFF